MKKFVVDERLAGKTVKDYFESEGYSTSQIKRFKYGGEIRVNGQIVTVRYALKAGDVVELATHNRLTTPLRADTAAEILYSDKYLYVAEKPYGVAIHPDRAHNNDTFGNMLARSFGEGFELRIVTRLDKTTSGLVLGAFDEVTAAKLNEMQQNHLITKQYVAEVDGVVESDNGAIELPLSRVENQNKTVADVNGKPAVTKYETVKRLAENTVVRLYPLTGRTHQIRAHLSAIGHPVTGDELYGGTPSTRVKLHCERLSFTHPYTNELVEITSPHNF